MTRIMESETERMVRSSRMPEREERNSKTRKQTR
jgi:hypothetical protein